MFEQYLRCEDEHKETEILSVLSAQNYEVTQSEKVEDQAGNMEDQFSTTMTKVVSNTFSTVNIMEQEKNKREDKGHESALEHMTASILPRLVPPVGFSDKVQSLGVSPSPMGKKSAVIRFSFKRKSCEGEETTFCEYLSN